MVTAEDIDIHSLIDGRNRRCLPLFIMKNGRTRRIPVTEV